MGPPGRADRLPARNRSIQRWVRGQPTSQQLTRCAAVLEVALATGFAPRGYTIEACEPHSSMIARQRWLPSLPGAGGNTEAAAAAASV